MENHPLGREVSHTDDDQAPRCYDLLPLTSDVLASVLEQRGILVSETNSQKLVELNLL